MIIALAKFWPLLRLNKHHRLLGCKENPDPHIIKTPFFKHVRVHSFNHDQNDTIQCRLLGGEGGKLPQVPSSR